MYNLTSSFSLRKSSFLTLSSLNVKLYNLVIIPILMAVASNIKIFTPMSPVPFTMQTFIVFLTLFNTDKLTSFLSFSIYLISGFSNLPFFASARGAAIIFSPSFGFIVGFLASSFFANNIKEFSTKLKYILRNILNDLFIIFIIYFFGYLNLLRFMDYKSAFIMGILPFVLFDFFKLIASKIVSYFWNKNIISGF
ncbi:MAG: biotin transporter BioY [Spirochaetes bacterium]|nr:biotin transporter BioY [Spirochaetota bacterium]MBP8991759.1 biotin transporter BioY [Spirochaetota bacterium]NLJ04311.1 biotin transporter BioY [Exilispira sp.]HOV45890.1 biotin transporter BioY [Exilispira sp.]HQQ19706.1 biotin transporter BioY [Exilispira sp.]